MSRSTIFLPACLLALFFAASAHGAASKEQLALAAANCTLDVPPDWHPIDLSKQPTVVAAFADPDGRRKLMVLTVRRGQPAPAVSATYADEYEKGVEKSGGGKKIAGRFMKVAGFDAYERRGAVNINGRDLRTLAQAIPTGDGTYLLEAISPQGDPGDDPEVTQSLASFRFLHPPGSPRRQVDTVYKASQTIGQASLVAIFIGLIVRAASKANSKRAARFPAGVTGAHPVPLAGFPTAAIQPPPLPGAMLPPPLPVVQAAPPPDLY